MKRKKEEDAKEEWEMRVDKDEKEGIAEDLKG